MKLDDSILLKPVYTEEAVERIKRVHKSWLRRFFDLLRSIKPR